MSILKIYDVENNVISLVSAVTNYLIGSQRSKPYVIDNILYSTYDGILGEYEQNTRADTYGIVKPEILRQAILRFDDITSESINLLVNTSKIHDKSIKKRCIKRIQKSLDALYECDMQIVELIRQYQTGCKIDNPKNLIEIQIFTIIFDFIDNYTEFHTDIDALSDKCRFMLKKLHKIFINNEIIVIQYDINPKSTNIIWNSEYNLLFSRLITLVQDLTQIISELDNNKNSLKNDNIHDDKSRMFIFMMKIICNTVSLVSTQTMYNELFRYDESKKSFDMDKTVFKKWLSDPGNSSLVIRDYDELRNSIYELTVGHMLYDDFMKEIQKVRDDFKFEDKSDMI